MKTRGPNPNPTAQAQSKRCLPLFTKTQNLIENALFRAPIFSGFCHLFRVFSQKMFKGVQGTPQSVKKTSKWSPQVARMAPRGAKLEPQSPPKYQKDAQMYPKGQKCGHRCHNEAPGQPQCQKRHQEATQSGTKAPGKTPGCQKTRTNHPRPGARRRRRRSGRGLEGRAHQAASRRPRSGAEAGVRGTSNKCFVLVGN